MVVGNDDVHGDTFVAAVEFADVQQFYLGCTIDLNRIAGAEKESSGWARCAIERTRLRVTRFCRAAVGWRRISLRCYGSLQQVSLDADQCDAHRPSLDQHHIGSVVAK